MRYVIIDYATLHRLSFRVVAEHSLMHYAHMLRQHLSLAHKPQRACCTLRHRPTAAALIGPSIHCAWPIKGELRAITTALEIFYSKYHPATNQRSSTHFFMVPNDIYARLAPSGERLIDDIIVN